MYRAMRDQLQGLARAQVHIVPVGLGRWATATTGRGWLRVLKTLDRVVDQALSESGCQAVTLVGHSSGGVMARLFLSPDPFEGHHFAGLKRVRHLITLGSPHHNVRGATLRRWVDETLPGAFFAPEVAYTTVAGRGIRGDPDGSLRERTVAGLYRHLCGRSDVWGDGLVPVSSAHLEGARNIVLEGVYHAPVAGARWFGSRDVLPRWWSLAHPEPGGS